MTTVSLAAILEALTERGLDPVIPDGIPATVGGVVDDSREVAAGDLFVAIKGYDADGHAFVADAASRGAAATLVERRVEGPLPQIIVTDSRVAAAIAASCWLGHPGKTLRMVGVTGTNGKTTTVALVRHLLNGASDIASIGTLGAFDGAGHQLEGTPPLTTPGPVALQRALARLRDGGTTGVVMEVSSHALTQARVAGIEFAAAVFTNLTHEHLDYHNDLVDYLEAKLLLLEYLGPHGRLVLNLDSPTWRQLWQEHPDAITFGAAGTGATVTAGDLQLGLGETRFTLTIRDQVFPVRIPLLGEFNVSNSLAAAATALALDVAPGTIVAGLESAPQIPGRMEILHRGDWLVLRDYAHTPDAFERVLATLRDATPGRLLILFGSGGDRDRKKRPILAETAGRLTDLVVVTTDNPRTEDPAQIMDDMAPGLAGHAYIRIEDRAEAIFRAMSMLQPGDTLLLAGKGHETYQIMGTVKEPFDERTVVADAIERLG